MGSNRTAGQRPSAASAPLATGWPSGASESAAMPVIRLRNVSKSWGTTKAVRDISFDVERGSFLVLLGPSGCGKSTTLRILAGLEEPTAGEVWIDGRNVTREAPSQRRIAMVFQSYALFPHLDVRENILFGLRVRKVARAERERRLRRVADLVGLAGLLDRKPSQLSGGQRQRVALARAIISEHPVCLMDEPLSNLDAKLRQEMRFELRALQQRLGMTVIYVTHDQAEAMSMADRILLLRDGRIEQAGAPEELYERPATLFAASFIGTPPMNLLELEDSPQGATIAGSRAVVSAGRGADRVLGIRPEHVRIVEQGGCPAELLATDYLGADTILSVRIGSQRMGVRVAGRFRAPSGEAVRIGWSPDHLHFFDARSGRRLESPEPDARGGSPAVAVTTTSKGGRR